MVKNDVPVAQTG